MIIDRTLSLKEKKGGKSVKGLGACIDMQAVFVSCVTRVQLFLCLKSLKESSEKIKMQMCRSSNPLSGLPAPIKDILMKRIGKCSFIKGEFK